MKKSNKILCIGILIVCIMLILKHMSVNLPDFIYGLCMGVGIGLELLGIYSINHNTTKFKQHKINILKKCLGKHK